MAHTVLRVPSVGRVVAAMSRRERRAYDAAVQALKGEGCRAGGKRLAAIDDGDYPMCQRSLYGAWRMTTVYRSPPDDIIVIVARAGASRRARSKGGAEGGVPVPAELMRLWSDYIHEKYRDLDCDHVFVNLWGGQIGRPLTSAAA